jgi:hypothetical protein
MHKLKSNLYFALKMSILCEQFEVLQWTLRGDIRIVSDYEPVFPPDIRKAVLIQRAPGCIQMALAKSFVANVIRARRICEHGSASLALDRTERRLFLSSTKALLHVRDVNEHGFDFNVGENRCRPSLHFHELGGYLDETALVAPSAEVLLMGPLNLYNIYRSVHGCTNACEHAEQSRALVLNVGKGPTGHRLTPARGLSRQSASGRLCAFSGAPPVPPVTRSVVENPPTFEDACRGVLVVFKNEIVR